MNYPEWGEFDEHGWHEVSPPEGMGARAVGMSLGTWLLKHRTPDLVDPQQGALF